jgi:hypothetical protein
MTQLDDKYSAAVKDAHDALQEFDDTVDMGDEGSVAGWWTAWGGKALDALDRVRCTPVHGSCNLLAGHAGQHDAFAATPSAIEHSEGYPGIAHDFETMRGLLRGVESLLTRCLRHGLLRAESETMLRDIAAALAIPSHEKPINALAPGERKSGEIAGPLNDSRESARVQSTATGQRDRANQERVSNPVEDSTSSSIEPSAYLVEFREVLKNGDKRRCTMASLEPHEPTLITEDHRIESRELLKVTPLYTGVPSAIEARDATRLVWLNLHWEQIDYAGGDIDTIRAAIDKAMRRSDGETPA